MSDVLFYGSGTALITPFSGYGLDFDAWERLIEYQLAEGADALIVLGTTGEAPTVSFAERCALVSAAVRLGRGKVPIIVSVGTNCTRMSVDLANAARDAGADALLLSAPYYNKPTPPGIKAHFFAVADSADLPIIAYNIPSRTGVNISPSLMAELARHPMIRGLKEASTDAAQITEMLTQFSDGLAVYSGNDSQTISIMAQGGRGVISVAGNLMPRQMHSLTSAMLSGDLRTARAIYNRMAPLISAFGMETNPGPIKCAMAMKGMCQDELRLPMCRVEDDTRRLVAHILEKSNITDAFE
jgi:4-hydroxy-tetrahydrodipicolinate synthase